MATNFRNSAGTDFDDLFDPYVAGTVPSNTGFRTSDGVDLAGRYAPLSYGTKRADVNYRTSAGTDLSNLWAAKGTATYVTDGGLPSGLNCTRGYSSSALTVSVDFSFRSDGSVTWSDGYPPVYGGGNWTTPSATAGDPYEIRLSILSSDGGTITGASGSWVPLSTSRIVKKSASVPAGGSAFYTTELRIEIRRAGTTNNLLDRTIAMLLGVGS